MPKVGQRYARDPVLNKLRVVMKKLLHRLGAASTHAPVSDEELIVKAELWLALNPGDGWMGSPNPEIDNDIPF